MIKPLEDRILVSVKEPEPSNGLIQLHDEIPDKGVVDNVGEGRYENGILVPVKILVGETVLFAPNSGRKVKDGDTEYLILSSRDIYAVIGDN